MITIKTKWLKAKPLEKLIKLKEKGMYSFDYPVITDEMLELADKIIRVDYWHDRNWFCSGRYNWHKEYCVEVKESEVEKALIGQFMEDVVKCSEKDKISLFSLVEIFNKSL